MAFILNKCSDRSVGSGPSLALVGNNDRSTNQETDMKVHGEVPLPLGFLQYCKVKEHNI